MGTLLLIYHCCVHLFCVSCIDDVVAILSHCCDIPVLGRVKEWLGGPIVAHGANKCDADYYIEGALDDNDVDAFYQWDA